MLSRLSTLRRGKVGVARPAESSTPHGLEKSLGDGPGGPASDGFEPCWLGASRPCPSRAPGAPRIFSFRASKRATSRGSNAASTMLTAPAGSRPHRCSANGWRSPSTLLRRTRRRGGDRAGCGDAAHGRAPDGPGHDRADRRGVLLRRHCLAELLAAGGQEFGPDAQGLDFSCSSGRVVRALHAAHPAARWHGCDPNAGAIEWAQASIPGVNFFVSNTAPPLPFEACVLDVVLGISVWSHFSRRRRWTGSQRCIGSLGPAAPFLTTHGLNSCVWFSHYRDPAIESVLATAGFTRLLSACNAMDTASGACSGQRG